MCYVADMNKADQIVVRLPTELKLALRKAAVADSRSVSSAVQAAIKAWLEARKP